jgi:transposase InsO family protein
MPRSSASAVPDPYARSTVLWPSAAVVKAQDELAALGLDDCPQRRKRSSYPGIWIRNGTPDHGKSAHFSVQLPASRGGYGPELCSRHILAWSVDHRIDLAHIQPGKPTQNGHVESFHGRLRDECLNVSWFWNLFDARKKVALWRRDYNEQRPHSSLKYLTPAEFASQASYGKVENVGCVSYFPTASAAAG